MPKNKPYLHAWETFEQFSISEDMIGEQATFLQDGMSVTLMSHEGAPISVTLPEQVVVTVVEADAVVKDQTASSSYKPATVDNGQRVMVPRILKQERASW